MPPPTQRLGENNAPHHAVLNTTRQLDRERAAPSQMERERYFRDLHLRTPLQVEIDEVNRVSIADHEKDAIRNNLINDVKNIILALKFETRPQPREIINHDSLLFFALIFRPDPLPWQKIKVAPLPMNTNMYEVLKAVILSLEQLKPTILEIAKQTFPTFDLVQPLLGQEKLIHEGGWVSVDQNIWNNYRSTR